MKLGQILVQAGVLKPEGLQAALNEQRRWGGHIGGILVDMGLVPEATMVEALAKQLNLPMVRLSEFTIHKEILDLVPAELADQHRLVPFNREGKFLDVAMADPTNLGIIDELRIRTQLNVRPYLAGPRAIQKALSRYYGRSGPNFGYGISDDLSSLGNTTLPANVDVIELDDRGARRQAPDVKTGEYPIGVTIQYGKPATRDDEIKALQTRIQQLEALVARDEDVLRKVLSLLIEKRIATREEILERIK
jgi:hypothetical protein